MVYIYSERERDHVRKRVNTQKDNKEKELIRRGIATEYRKETEKKE